MYLFIAKDQSSCHTLPTLREGLGLTQVSHIVDAFSLQLTTKHLPRTHHKSLLADCTVRCLLWHGHRQWSTNTIHPH